MRPKHICLMDCNVRRPTRLLAATQLLDSAVNLARTALHATHVVRVSKSQGIDFAVLYLLPEMLTNLAETHPT